jgi:hypothetical protein
MEPAARGFLAPGFLEDVAMTCHRIFPIAWLVVATILMPLSRASADSLPANWDNLVKVDSKKMAGVYLLPGADFRPYTKVMLDPTEVSFKKDWMREHNNSTAFTSRVTSADVHKAIEKAQSLFGEVLAKAFTDAGYQIVTAPGDDVLRLRTAVANLDVDAPDVAVGRVRTATEYAGSATVVFEARESMSGALLGRAVDARAAGDTSVFFFRNRATNYSDFQQLFRRWAESSVKGLATLKQMSPVNMATPHGDK